MRVALKAVHRMIGTLDTSSTQPQTVRKFRLHGLLYCESKCTWQISNDELRIHEGPEGRHPNNGRLPKVYTQSRGKPTRAYAYRLRTRFT